MWSLREQKRHRNKSKLTPNLLVMLVREGHSDMHPVLCFSDTGTRAPWSSCLLAAPPHRDPQPGHTPAQNTKPIVSSSSCSSSPASTQLLAALGPNQSLALILAPGLQGSASRGQDFAGHEEIVNPSLAQSGCFVFIKVGLTTASSWGGWRWLREERGERASGLHHLTLTPCSLQASFFSRRF